MKFSNSQRVVHDIKYNPPCNYYNVDQKNEKKVLFGSLAGLKVVSEGKNTFGFQKRFEKQQKNMQTPGPAQYFQSKKVLVYDFKKDLTNPKKFLKNTFRNAQLNPSIPYKRLNEENFDEEDKVFLKELSLVQNPAKASQKVHKKQPSYSFAKSPRKLLSQDESNSKQKKKELPFQKKFQQDLPKVHQKESFDKEFDKNGLMRKKSFKKNLIKQNETIRKASKIRNEVINNIGPDFVPSLQLIDLMSKMRTKYVPGPGTYDTSQSNSFTDAIDAINESGRKGAVFSTVKRFDADKKTIIGPGSYNLGYDSLSKKGGHIPKQKRTLFNLKQSKDIEYRFYINPYDNCAKQHIQTAPQRSSSMISLRKRQPSQISELSGGFGSSSRRFSLMTASNNEEDRRSTISEYQLQKKSRFKNELKARIKKLHNQDRRSTKEDSGLLGISTLASAID